MDHIITLGNGSWTALGLVVFSIFLFIFLLLAVAFVIFAFRPGTLSLPQRQTTFTAVLLSILFFLVASFLVPYFVEFTSIKIKSSGEWVLRNGWNIPLATLPPSRARNIDAAIEDVTWYGRSQSSYEAVRIYIITDNKVYYSRSSQDLDAVGTIVESLENRAADQNIPESANVVDPFSIYNRWHIAHRVLAVLFALALLSPLVFFKKKI